MLKKLSFKIVVALIPLALLSFHLLSTVSAADNITVNSRSDWHADESLVTAEKKYGFPTKLTIVVLDTLDSSADSSEQVQELYYYFAVRSGLGDLPFHFIITPDGRVYSGNSLGNEAKVTLGSATDSLLVGCILDGENSIAISAIDNLKQLILTNLNTYSIKPTDVSIKKLTYTFGSRGRLENIILQDAPTTLTEELQPIISSLAKEYAPIPMNFKAEISSVSIPDTEFTPSEIAEVSVTVKNTGEFSYYFGVNTLFLAHNNPLDARSAFFISDEWSSPSRITLLKEGERFATGEEKTFNIRLFVPLYPPEKSEDFVLIDPNGKAIDGTNFTIKIKIVATDKTIIEITDTGTGYLNVRATPGLGTVVTQVVPGERFIVLDSQPGYYKISANGKEGWIVSTYTKVIK